MDIDYLLLINRWVHISAAIAALGGALFKRFVLMPAAASLEKDQRDRLREAVRRRWALFVHVSITLLLITGALNFYFLVLVPKIAPGPYVAIFGLKIIGALIIFFLASVLAGRSPGFEKWRTHSAKWLSVLIITGAVVVLLSGALNQIRSSAPSGAPTTTITTP